MGISHEQAVRNQLTLLCVEVIRETIESDNLVPFTEYRAPTEVPYATKRGAGGSGALTVSLQKALLRGDERAAGQLAARIEAIPLPAARRAPGVLDLYRVAFPGFKASRAKFRMKIPGQQVQLDCRSGELNAALRAVWNVHRSPLTIRTHAGGLRYEWISTLPAHERQAWITLADGLLNALNDVSVDIQPKEA
ncbi:hypothetical protein [Deinococcus sedimenti]|uniref:Uncharacterized protein n=1 Tax=Deinococcus sedimenti TaxID=1867090 RepID=A0ABQ2RZS7_9DEIO|nr:hypothetical protein [Deinococcus sedimenti]GGR84383.1 hypothetical protein GCM10008960_09270 [Deinococcus sedimenti]